MLKSMINPDLSGKKLSLVLGFMLIMLLALSTSLMAQTTHTVGVNGCDFTTIQAAINDAGTVNGDIISVEDATHIEAGITVSKNLTIQGHGASSTTVQAHANPWTASDRVFSINSNLVVTLKDMTIKHGYVNTGTDNDGGGGIKIAQNGTYLIEGCNIEYNGTHTSSYQWGGGINIDGINSFNRPTVTIRNCTIANNKTFASSGYAAGLSSNYANTTIENSTFHDNVTEGSNCRGGAIQLRYSISEVTNCTVFNNTGTMYSGGMWLDRTTTYITNCTIVKNICTTSGGGGIQSYSGNTYLKNVLIANNKINTTTPMDYYDDRSTVIDNGYNLVEYWGGYGDPIHDFSSVGTNITGDQTNLFLSSTLQDNYTLNGTQTLKTTSGSVAINAGGTGTNGSVSVPSTDQRGAERNGDTDIGAYEYWDDDASLPVELSSFTAECRGAGVLLKWSTESEIENLGFILERRSRGAEEQGDWEEIAGYLSNTALEGHGSTTEKHEYQYIDKAVQPGATYEYRLGDVDYSGKVTWHKKVEIKVKIEGAKIPTEFGLQRAYPNPFNPSTTISYQLASASFVEISIYDIRGKLVETLVNEQKDRGNYSVVWDAGGLSSGIYFYKIAAGKYSEVNKCLLIR